MPELDKKYRPKTWDELFGNNALKQALQKKIENDDLPRRLCFSGSKGCGKCIDENSYIYTDVGMSRLSSLSKGIDGFSKLEMPILSYLGIEDTSFFFEENAEDTIEIVDYLGLKLRGTQEHGILTLDKNLNFQFKRLDEIKIGDYACINRTNHFFPKNRVKLEFEQSRNSRDSNSIKLKNLPNVVDRNLATLLGYIVANSYQDKNCMLFSSNNHIFKEELRGILDSYGIDISNNYHKKDFSIGGVWLCRLVSDLFGLDKLPKAREKFIPKCILESPEDVQAAFLRSLIDCDGYYGKEGYIEYSTASDRLATEVQLILLNFCIISTKVSKYLEEYDHTYHSVYITSEDLDRYMTLIGSIKFNVENKKRNTNRDTIPFLMEFLREKRKELREIFKVRKSGTFTYDGKTKRFKCMILPPSKNISYSSLSKFRKSLYDLPYIKEVSDLIKLCDRFLDSYFYFSPINNKNEIREKIKVYDFTVPKTHSFIANGYINHNTTISRLIANSYNVPYYKELNFGKETGIQDIRDLLSTIKQPWLTGKDESKKRFYILDEFHNLSRKGQNALLKDGEEPPDDVYFIICTTEPESLIDTIQSRFKAHFKVNPLSPAETMELLGYICRNEGWNKIPLKILKKIAIASEGTPREAVIMLDLIHDIEDEQDALDIISFGVKEVEIRDICTALGDIKNNNPWASVQEKLRNFKGDSETARLAISNWFAGILTSPKSNPISVNRADIILPYFLDSFIYSKKAGLIMSCRAACLDISKNG